MEAERQEEEKWKQECRVAQEGHREDNMDKKGLAEFLKFDPITAQKR